MSPRPVHIIAVPYDSGHRDERMGAGPLRLLQGGLESRLAARAGSCRTTVLESSLPFQREIGTSSLLQQGVAKAVRAATKAGELPIVLSGNCNNACVGTVAGLGAGTGVVWFDAHGDFNTPETSPTGYLDGMALAMLTGRCWRPLTAHVEGYTPVAEETVVLAGAHDLDPVERELIAKSQIALVESATIRREGIDSALGPALDTLAGRVSRVYLHLDLDVHDVDEIRVNGYSVTGGLLRRHLLDAIRLIASRVQIAGAALTAFDPSVDEDGRTLDAALALAEEVTAVAAA